MKFETLLLHSVSVVCLLACGLVFGAMLLSQPPIRSAQRHVAATRIVTAPISCPLPPDGLVCLRRPG